MIKYFRLLYYLNQLMRNPFYKKDELRKIQNRKLRKIVSHSYETVQYYHDLFKKSGIHPNDIKDIEDINKIPILRKKDIQYNTKKLISQKYNIQKLELHSTSGSTGVPLDVYLDEKEDHYRKAKHLRANLSCGMGPRDKWVTITSPNQFTHVSPIQKKLGIFAPEPLSVFIGAKAQLDVLNEKKPDILDGFSSSLYLLAKEAEKRGEHQVSPKMMFSGAELSSENSRKYIEDIFSAPFYDQYATIELERIAWQCPEQIGYHMDVDSVIVQFVDEEGHEVNPGETGEVVCTSLFNYAMPLLRYAVGDAAVPSDETCPCGRNFPLMEVVSGRKGDFVQLPDGRLLSPTSFVYVFILSPWNKYIDQYRLIQKKVDYFELYIVKRDPLTDEKELNKKIINDIHSKIGIKKGDIKINIIYVDDIPLEKTGKLRAVISEIS